MRMQGEVEKEEKEEEVAVVVGGGLAALEFCGTGTS
jgi:hypothetical protein